MEEQAKYEAKPAQVPALIEFDADVRAMMPRNFEGLWRMSTIMAKSGMMPTQMNDKPEMVFVAVQMGMEVGLPPMAAVQNIAVINGRPSIWGDAVLGLVRASGLLESFQESFKGTFPNEDYVAVCTAKRKGDPVEMVREFSVADAMAAGLWCFGDPRASEKQKYTPWYKYPKRMLQMRARSWALRDGFGDVLRGLQVREEMRDITPMERQADGSYGADTELTEKIKNLKTEPDNKPGVYPPPYTARNSEDFEKEETNGIMERFIAEFINLKSAGYSTYIHNNLERLRGAPENVLTAARDKWAKLYPDNPWPLEDDSDPDNVVLEGLKDDWRSCHSIDATIANQIISECGELETEDDYRGALKLFETMLDQKNGE